MNSTKNEKIIKVKGKDVPQEFIFQKLDTTYEKNTISLSKKLTKFSYVKQNNCPICRRKNTKKECSFYGITYLRCQNCSHVFTDKRLSDKSLKKFYEKNTDYFSGTYTNKKLLKIRTKIFEPKINFIKKFVRARNWLDIGSGDGTSISVINKAGFVGQGIEPSESSRNYARRYRGITLYPNSLEEFNKENTKKWDVISYFGVLEHLSNPMMSLKLSNKLLKKGGIIAIEVPNFDSFSTKVQKMKINPSRHLFPHSHLMMFTLKSLNHALLKTGFQPVAVWFWGMDQIEFLKYLKNKIKDFDKSELFAILVKLVNEHQKVIDDFEMSDFILMLARKVK